MRIPTKSPGHSEMISPGVPTGCRLGSGASLADNFSHSVARRRSNRHHGRPRAVRARAMPRMLVTPLPCIANASAISLQALMEARRAAASRGPLVRYVEPIQGNHRVEKLTHCSACFENDWRFCGSAFCTPTSSPQVRRHVVGKRVHPHRSAEAPATDAYEGLS